MKYEELTSKIIGICIKVHSILGPGLLESVYEEAICYELDKAGIKYRRQPAVSINYETIKFKTGYRADLIVDERVIVELKSVEMLAPVHPKIVLTYMRLSKIEVGLLINFNVPLLKDGIIRLVDDKVVTARQNV